MAQDFKNHARIYPLFHLFVLPMLLINFVAQMVRLFRHFSVGSAIAALTAFALIALALSARTFALTVQDRVIRLEMRLRLAQILPPDLRVRILDFTPEQLVGMRFASDAELPELARKVLQDKIAKRKPIKMLIKDWQGDYLRA